MFVLVTFSLKHVFCGSCKRMRWVGVQIISLLDGIPGSYICLFICTYTLCKPEGGCEVWYKLSEVGIAI